MGYYSTYGGVSLGVAIPIFVIGCLCWGIMRRCGRERWKQHNRTSRLVLPPASSNMAGHENSGYTFSETMPPPNSNPASRSQSREGTNQSNVYVIPSPAIVQPPPPYSECVSPSEPPPPYVP